MFLNFFFFIDSGAYGGFSNYLEKDRYSIR